MKVEIPAAHNTKYLDHKPLTGFQYCSLLHFLLPCGYFQNPFPTQMIATLAINFSSRELELRFSLLGEEIALASEEGYKKTQ